MGLSPAICHCAEGGQWAVETIIREGEVVLLSPSPGRSIIIDQRATRKAAYNNHMHPQVKTSCLVEVDQANTYTHTNKQTPASPSSRGKENDSAAYSRPGLCLLLGVKSSSNIEWLDVMIQRKNMGGFALSPELTVAHTADVLGTAGEGVGGWAGFQSGHPQAASDLGEEGLPGLFLLFVHEGQVYPWGWPGINRYLRTWEPIPSHQGPGLPPPSRMCPQHRYFLQNHQISSFWSNRHRLELPESCPDPWHWFRTGSLLVVAPPLFLPSHRLIFCFIWVRRQVGMSNLAVQVTHSEIIIFRFTQLPFRSLSIAPCLHQPLLHAQRQEAHLSSLSLCYH